MNALTRSIWSWCLLSATAVAQQDAGQRQAFPITLEPASVREIDALKLNYAGLQLRGEHIAATPIDCEAGTTGAFLIGSGTFRFAPKDGEVITGEFRAAMLRFNPQDQPKWLPLAKANVVTDRAAFEMSKQMLNVVFGHCWHSGNQAILPSEGTLAVVLYSKEHGDLLISVGGDQTMAYSFTDRKQLFPNP